LRTTFKPMLAMVALPTAVVDCGSDDESSATTPTTAAALTTAPATTGEPTVYRGHRTAGVLRAPPGGRPGRLV
jgi:hypothetical protein